MRFFSYKTPLLCNQSCYFCVTSAKFSNKKYLLPIKKVLKDFLILKKKWYTDISIEWWEPTLLTNLNSIIKLWFKLRLNISIITNWYNLDLNSLNLLYNSWLRNITFSIHSNDKSIHDSLVWLEWSYDKICESIKNSLKIWFNVSTNTVICNKNQDSLLEIIDYINNNFNWITRIAFCNIEANVNNLWDYNSKEFLFTNFEILKKNINKIENNIVEFDNLPLCIFEEKKLIYASIMNVKEKNEESLFKNKFEKCWQCYLNDYCRWVLPYFKNIDNFIIPFRESDFIKNIIYNKTLIK